MHKKLDPLFSVLEIGWEALPSKCQTIFPDLVLHISYAHEMVGKDTLHLEGWYCSVDMNQKGFSELASTDLQMVHFIIYLFHWHVCVQGGSSILLHNNFPCD